MENHPVEVAERGSLALVTYIPDPLSTFLHDLRLLLPGDHYALPHVTILPPRPLRTSIESASRAAQSVLERFPSFEIELCQVNCFPQTNVLYLNLAHGHSELHHLHDALNTGELAHPEKFEFLPHVTLAGPVPSSSMDAARERVELAWSSATCPPKFTVREVVCLWLSPTAVWGDWQRLWSQVLGTGAVSADHAAAAVTGQTY